VLQAENAYRNEESRDLKLLLAKYYYGHQIKKKDMGRPSRTKRKNVYKVLMGKYEEKGSLRRPRLV
jgi:hypothetical protein